MKKQYDIAVVGAGPAGSMAARTAAQSGADVLLMEKDLHPGMPVRCAEGVAEDALQNLVDIDEKWVLQRIRGAELIAPDGTRVMAKEEGGGYILDRRIFDRALADMAVAAGADLQAGTFASGMKRQKDGTWKISAEQPGGSAEVAARLVIGADGVESRVGRWAGIDTALRPEDIESCYQYVVEGIHIDPGLLQFYVTREFAPGGYAWVFPRSETSANIGLGVLGTYVKQVNPARSLRAFMDRYFPRGTVVSQRAGGVPVIPGLDRMTAAGVLLAGDAARQVDPISGGGITLGMYGGRMAAQHSIRALEQHDTSAENLAALRREWDKYTGRQHRVSLKLRNVIDNTADSVFNDLAVKMLKIPLHRRTYFSFFRTMLVSKPGLLLAVARSMF